jgi:hypothetical protein
VLVSDGDGSWSDREIYDLAPGGPHKHDGGTVAVLRARRDALATRAAILRKHPDVEVSIFELTTAEPEDDDRVEADFIRDDDGVLVAPWMMEDRAKRSPRAAELLMEWKAERLERELFRRAARDRQGR